MKPKRREGLTKFPTRDNTIIYQRARQGGIERRKNVGKGGLRIREETTRGSEFTTGVPPAFCYEGGR